MTKSVSMARKVVELTIKLNLVDTREGGSVEVATDCCMEAVDEYAAKIWLDKKALAEYRARFGCLTCGEIHGEEGCPPVEARTAGRQWFSSAQAINRFNAMESRIALMTGVIGELNRIIEVVSLERDTLRAVNEKLQGEKDQLHDAFSTLVERLETTVC